MGRDLAGESGSLWISGRIRRGEGAPRGSVAEAAGCFRRSGVSGMMLAEARQMTEIKQRDEGGIVPWPENEKEPKPGELDPQQYAAALKAHELFVGMANPALDYLERLRVQGLRSRFTLAASRDFALDDGAWQRAPR